MSSESKVASHRQILEDPRNPGTGIIVAAGDPIPAHALGYVENTPNKVDAARNADVADAADQAATRPNERIVSTFGSAGNETAEIHDRVAANTAAYHEKVRSEMDPQGWLPREDFSGGARVVPDHEKTGGGEPSEGDGEAASSSELEKLTVTQLDELADQLGDGKPASYGGNKAEKVAALAGRVTGSDVARVAEA